MSKYFDILAYLMGKQAGGGGGDITVESKSFSANGTYTAPSGKAYSPVTVYVPNSYAAGDEGKVVYNGQLVAQGSDTVTQNGPVDTTLINSLVVNVEGEDMKEWTLLATVDCSQNSGNIELNNLNSLTEFAIYADGVHNESSTASGYSIYVNGTLICEQVIGIAKTGTTQNQWYRVKYNGLYWETYAQGSTTNSVYHRGVNLQGVYTYDLGVGKATALKLSAPNSQYQASSGTIKIYGR